MTIKELTTDNEYKAIYPTYKEEFNEDLNEQQFLEVFHNMAAEGCRLFAVEDNDEIVTVTCIAVRTDFANGKHLYVYEMATHPEHRSKGYGKQLMDHLETWAKDQGCEKVILYSGLQREGAHRFWEHHRGYERRGIVFKKEF